MEIDGKSQQKEFSDTFYIIALFVFPISLGKIFDEVAYFLST